jgi:uncharacterized protein YeaC (DUF1315 family)
MECLKIHFILPTVFQSSVSAADIAIWATLYPLTVEQKFASILPVAVCKWHESLSARPEFKVSPFSF